MILVDPYNRQASELAERLQADLPAAENLDVDLVIGGDGFMLKTLAEDSDRVCLGLNAGRIGFLMNDTDAWDRVIDRLQRRAWTVYEFPTLQAELTLANSEQVVLRAVNDVAIERSTGQTAHLALDIDTRRVVERLVADGLVVSTALGSTAYTFSAGGPAVHPTLPLLAITAICPHHPRLAPFVLPEDSTVRIAVHDSHRRPVRVVADGRTTDDVLRAVIGIAPERVRLAWLEGHDHTARIVAKILRP